jgi:hypothetical protein
VLADDDLGNALVVGIQVIIFVSIQKHYHVCVLLNGARIAKVGEERTLVVALFDGAA